MKLFTSLFIVDLKRAILSVRFLFCVVAIALVMLFSSSGVFLSASDSLGLLGFSLSGTGSIILILGILPLFPFSTNFSYEWEQKISRFWMIRTGITNYSLSKITVSAISGFLTTVLGFILFIFITLVKHPFFQHVSTGDAYAVLLENNQPIKYFFYFITHYSLTSALFAVVALWVSSYIPNPFVAVSVPFVLYFILHRFTTLLDIPLYLKAVVIVERIYDNGGPFATLLLKFITVVCLILFIGFATIKQIKRRVYKA